MELTHRENRQILFVDMNSFFASCEQAENPALLGKPIIVIPTEGSCALAASYEAKRFGIKTGTRERDAKFLCPQVIAIKARPKVYMHYHYQFIEILENLTPKVTVRSVDEASIELCSNEDPWELGREIKQELWRRFGKAINCSIGIGPNVFLAKLGTEMQKPDGLTEITLENLEETYRKVRLRDFCGISYATERRLHQLAIYSPLDFYHTDPGRLRQFLGVVGERWWLNLHGYRSELPTSGRKSLSHSHVLPPHQRTPDQAYITLQRLITKVGRRLRKAGMMTQHIGLYIRFSDKSKFYEGLQVRPTSDTIGLADHVRRLWDNAQPKRSVLQLAVWTSNLTPAQGIPEPLFPEDRKRFSLARAIDTINDRYGTDVVHFAVLDQDASMAPDRISFNSLFDIEHE